MNERIKELVIRILKNKMNYYLGKPTISDEEYDKLEDELRSTDPENEILKFVGYGSKGEIIHNPPMLSCKKLNDIEEAVKWGENNEVIWGYKVDGLSIKIVYVGGVLFSGSTRGDGKKGENVTCQCNKIANIPKKIKYKSYIEVRGEAYIPLSSFKEIEGYKSPRNLATGTMLAKDPELVMKRGLQFIAWDLVVPGKNYDIVEKQKFLGDLGFQFADRGKVLPVALPQIYKLLIDERKNLDFEIDGLIVKINSHEKRDEIGETEHHPRWMICVKFPSDKKQVKVKSIGWQHGRSGVFTPVAKIYPVDICGATISRVTLHNCRYIIENKITEGTIIEIIRSGDIIPKVVSVVSNSGDPYIPEKCFYCKTKLIRDDVNLCCPNDDCKGNLYMSLFHLIKEIDIEGLGRETFSKLWKNGIVEKASDLFNIKEEVWYENFGVNGNKIFKNLQEKRILDYEVFLSAIGVESLSKSTAKKLSKDCIKINEITVEYLMSKEGIGKKKAEIIIESIKKNKIWRDLLTVIEIRYNKMNKKESVITGMKIYITGSVPNYKKEELQNLVEKYGGLWKGISKSLDLLVVGNNPGQVKIDKANEYGIKMISADKFLEMIGEK